MTPEPVTPHVTVQPGDVVHLAEPDYQYSDGEVVLRITRVLLDISRWYDGEWVWLEGNPIRGDGHEGSIRNVLARVSALPHDRA